MDMDSEQTFNKESIPLKIKGILEKECRGKIEEFDVINKELCIVVKENDLLHVCRYLKESSLDFNFPRCLSGVDKVDHLEVVIHLGSITNNYKITIKVKLCRDSAVIPSLYSIYKGLEWHERETAELLGIKFEGHPDPRHLLLEENFEGYPLRKDFSLNKVSSN